MAIMSHALLHPAGPVLLCAAAGLPCWLAPFVKARQDIAFFRFACSSEHDAPGSFRLHYNSLWLCAHDYCKASTLHFEASLFGKRRQRKAEAARHSGRWAFICLFV